MFAKLLPQNLFDIKNKSEIPFFLFLIRKTRIFQALNNHDRGKVLSSCNDAFSVNNIHITTSSAIQLLIFEDIIIILFFVLDKNIAEIILPNSSTL